MEKFRYFFKWNHILLIVQISMHHARQEQQLLVAGVRIALDHFGEGIPAEAAGVRLPEKIKHQPAGKRQVEQLSCGCVFQSGLKPKTLQLQ